ncbi:MAG: methyltransferase domain-containing protein [Anaerolineaceae bacterium]|nr:methyltransferase domain-containing protein [Anaerolineaceae bacterium]
MPVIDHFGLIAPIYERVFGSNRQAEWLERLALSKGMRLLDVGGGTGRVAQHLVCDSCDVIVADESLGMLKKALEKDSLQAVGSHAEKLPFLEKSFDRVLMVDAMHHVSNQKWVANELFRVLKPGGFVLIQEPDIRTLFVKLIALAEKLLFMRSHFLDHEEIAALFGNAPVLINTINDQGSAWIRVQRLE